MIADAWIFLVETANQRVQVKIGENRFSIEKHTSARISVIRARLPMRKTDHRLPYWRIGDLTFEPLQ